MKIDNPSRKINQILNLCKEIVEMKYKPTDDEIELAKKIIRIIKN